ncbi:MAG: DUF5060 domain-containing protein [Bryobacterales bacterium]|nr:DUF5060 domain-containing protein [Bryobacterales bacterium]
MQCKCWLLVGVLSLGTAGAENFTRGASAARQFGVHEIELRQRPGGGNPFAAASTVKFTAPSGRETAVKAFYDGGETWRARVYVSESGQWRWQSSTGENGVFRATSSALPGMLRRHRDNPRQWMTENGRWFLNLSDTSYFLFLADHKEWQRYVREDFALGITSLRATAIPAKDFGSRPPQSEWDAYCADADCTRPRLENFQTTDARLEWMLNNYPEMYVQMILFPRGSLYARDEAVWAKFSGGAKKLLMEYMLARFAAYPQLYWLVVNDTHYGPKFPNNNAMASEVGEYFAKHDPWGHLLSTGPVRFMTFPFRGAAWVSYYHIEDAFQLGADKVEQYRADPMHVFLGEDRYEQDRGRVDPRNPVYYYRCLFWSWLLAGGSANYGGRWERTEPYSETGSKPYRNSYGDANPDHRTYFQGLKGLDSVIYIKKFFAERQLDLAGFEPKDGLVPSSGGGTGQPRPKLTHRGGREYLVYDPNAAVGGMDAAPDTSRTARFKVDLTGVKGTFRVEWYRPADGAAEAGEEVMGGAAIEFVAPWKGCDVILYLRTR